MFLYATSKEEEEDEDEEEDEEEDSVLFDQYKVSALASSLISYHLQDVYY